MKHFKDTASFIQGISPQHIQPSSNQKDTHTALYQKAVRMMINTERIEKMQGSSKSYRGSKSPYQTHPTRIVHKIKYKK